MGKHCLKIEFAFFFNLDNDYSYYYFVKCTCRQTLLELNSQEPYPSSEGEHYLFMSSIKCGIRHFYLVGVQWWQKKVQKVLSTYKVQSCCFACYTYSFLDVLVVVTPLGS